MARTAAREYFVIYAYMFTIARHVEKKFHYRTSEKIVLTFGILQCTALCDVRLLLLGIPALLSSRI
jgi:hypothetical protein